VSARDDAWRLAVEAGQMTMVREPQVQPAMVVYVEDTGEIALVLAVRVHEGGNWAWLRFWDFTTGLVPVSILNIHEDQSWAPEGGWLP
jgi:hypothetical protein